MNNWGRYELVAPPADCDLVFEIGLLEGQWGLRPVILDPRTHVVQWTLTEYLETTVPQGNRDRNFDEALAKIVNDVKKLVAEAAATTNAHKWNRGLGVG